MPMEAGEFSSPRFLVKPPSRGRRLDAMPGNYSVRIYDKRGSRKGLECNGGEVGWVTRTPGCGRLRASTIQGTHQTTGRSYAHTHHEGGTKERHAHPCAIRRASS